MCFVSHSTLYEQGGPIGPAMGPQNYVFGVLELPPLPQSLRGWGGSRTLMYKRLYILRIVYSMSPTLAGESKVNDLYYHYYSYFRDIYLIQGTSTK